MKEQSTSTNLTEIILSTKWVDYVEEPMKYQALRPQFFSVGGWGWGWVGVGWVGWVGWMVVGWGWWDGWWGGAEWWRGGGWCD